MAAKIGAIFSSSRKWSRWRFATSTIRFREQGIALTEGRAKPYKDFRRVLEQKDIDAVIVAAPDHWHALMTVAACDAGKDVYCEKPLSLMAQEGRKMVDAARRNKRVVQAGSQQRSGAHYIQAVELIQDGRIGEVHRIEAGMQRNIFPGSEADCAAGRPDLRRSIGICGSDRRRKRPFDPFRCIYNFRWFWDYSGGQMTNWGAHHLDIARWIVERSRARDRLRRRRPLRPDRWRRDARRAAGDLPLPEGGGTWTTSEIGEGDPLTLNIYGTKGMMTLLRSGFKISRRPRRSRAARKDAADGRDGSEGRRPQRSARPQLPRLREEPQAAERGCGRGTPERQ